ncbi:MAG: UDP-N-acetylmuramate dehydrogenase [Microbacteriaceae bacterium]
MPTAALSTLTTIGVGGAPDRLIEPKTREDLVAVARAVWASDEPWLLLGGGSNTVASEAGFEGTVIRIGTRGLEHVAVEQDDAVAAPVVRLRIQAGERWDDVVAHTVQRGWAGIEALSGIPGSVGAAPVQNIGAYGQELSGTLSSIEFLDYDSGEVRRLLAAELDLGYRTSALKRGLRGLTLSIDLDLTVAEGGDGQAHGEPARYPQLADALGVQLGTRVPLARVRSTVLGLRAAKGMVLDAADPDTASAGSFFTNPIVDEAFSRTLPPDAPRWPLDELNDESVVVPLDAASATSAYGVSGSIPELAEALAGRDLYATSDSAMVKLSAAWLIEHAGIPRGFRLPGSAAAVSSKHTLALTNTGGATGEQVAELARFIRNRVLSDFGIGLQPEPVLVGLTL